MARTVPESRTQITLSYAPVVREVAPAVVNIYTSRTVTRQVSPFMNDPFFEQFFGRSFGGFGAMPRQRVESALGSGVIVDAAGYAVTNAHVIAGAEEIIVGLSDGREFEAEIVVIDEPSDLAILKIDPAGETLPAVDLKPSESMEVGDLVLAIGNPFGVGQTVTGGIISAQARSTLNINDYNFFIQTDAAINPGNSGGPLVAMDGKVIGINTAIYSRSGGHMGIGFAIPSEMVATVVAAAQAGQTVAGRGIIRPWLGVSVQKVTADIADSLAIDTPRGVLVSGLHRASPAKKAGLRVGDIVLSVNGRTIREPEEMKFRMATIPLGGKAQFDVLRAGQSRLVTVTAIAPPDDPPRHETTLDGNHILHGVRVANINPAVAVELGLREESGVVVMDVARQSQASRFVRPGDIILDVMDHSVARVADLEKALRQGSGAQGWHLTLSRNGRRQQIMMR